MGIRSLSSASIASGAKRSKFWDQSSVYITNAYESIATVTIPGATSGNQVNTIDFNLIPSTYKHLQLRGIARDTWTASGVGEFYIFPNSSTGPYTEHYITGNGSGALPTASLYTSRSDGAWVGHQVRGGSGANFFGAFIIDIWDYADVNKFKTIRSIGGADVNGSGSAMFQSSTWLSTSAISSLHITANGYGFAQYSHFALYGIKG